MIPNGQPVRPAGNAPVKASSRMARTVVSPPPHLVPILEALMGGQTDVAASRRLNMSPRTFSRRVAELLDYLGVETRFQGGVKIAQSGWVPGASGGTTEVRREIIAARLRTEHVAAPRAS